MVLILGGNPAAVCLLDSDIGDDLKQKIAAEMNLSETAFVVSEDKNGRSKDLSCSDGYENAH